MLEYLPQLILFAGLVYLPLAVGAFLRHGGYIKRDVSKQIMTFCWLTLEPVAIVISFWALRLDEVADLISAPLIGGIWMVLMLMAAMLVAKRMHLNHLQRGNLMLASMFSNNGITLGAFLCLIFFNIEGQALALLFNLLFMPLLLTVGFEIGRRGFRKHSRSVGGDHVEAPSMGLLRLVPYLAMAIGIILNLKGVRQPEIALPINRVIVYIDVAIYSLAIGTLFSLSVVLRYIRQCIVITSMKFFISPIVGLLLFAIFNQFAELSPLMFSVMIVQCSMPVAIMSVVVSRFTHLDTELAAAFWVFTTLAVAFIVPILAMIAGMLSV